MRCNVGDIGCPRGAEMAQRLNNRTRRAAWGDEMLGRGMSKIDDALSDDNTTRRSVGQI